MFNPDLKKLLKGCNSRYSLVEVLQREQEKFAMKQLNAKNLLMLKPYQLLLMKFLTESM